MAASGILFGGGEGASGGVPERPNVVVVLSDDEAAAWQRHMETVNTRIGRRGATFAQSFTNWPLCCPSRATFLTGQYAVNHGVRGNAPPSGGYDRFKPLHATNNLATWLREDGYYTGLVGKYLNGYGIADPLEVPPGWNEWRATVLDQQRVYDYDLNENGVLAHYGNHARDFKGDVLTRKAVRFIDRRAPRRRPFFLYVGYTAPHTGGPNPNPQPPANCSNSAKPAPRHAHAFDREPLPQPPNFNEKDVSDKPQAVRDLPSLTNAEIASLRRTYRCRIESLLHIDEGVGEMIDALRSAGELGRTLFIYTSDNGFFRGEHRIRNGKNRVYEEGIRVPLLIRGPGVPKGVRVRELATNADLAPTILGAAGVDPGLTVDGRSLLPAAARPTAQRGRELLIEKGAISDEDEDDPNSFVAIRNRRYVYVEYGNPFNGEVELYDTVLDPFQLESLHADPAYDEVEEALAARLAALRTCSGETCRLKPELKLRLDFESVRENGRSCASRPVRARVRGSDVPGVTAVAFRVNGEKVGADFSAPFQRRLPHSRLQEQERSTVGTVIDMLDGRRLTRERTVRACD